MLSKSPKDMSIQSSVTTYDLSSDTVYRLDIRPVSPGATTSPSSHAADLRVIATQSGSSERLELSFTAMPEGASLPQSHLQTRNQNATPTGLNLTEWQIKSWDEERLSLEAGKSGTKLSSALWGKEISEVHFTFQGPTQGHVTEQLSVMKGVADAQTRFGYLAAKTVNDAEEEKSEPAHEVANTGGGCEVLHEKDAPVFDSEPDSDDSAASDCSGRHLRRDSTSARPGRESNDLSSSMIMELGPLAPI